MISAVQDVFTKAGYVLVAVLCLMFMIVVHEFGHFIAGRRLGFQVNEFAIGFGPAIFKRKMRNGTVFSIRPVPLGGYCAFEGEERDNDNPRAFNNMPPWKRIIVLFMGAFFNFLSAVIIITIFFCAYGEPVSVVSRLYEDSPASGVVEEGDVILAVNGAVKHILTPDDFARELDRAGDTARLRILRDGKTITVSVKRGSYGYYAPEARFSFCQILFPDGEGWKSFDPEGWTLEEVNGKAKNAGRPLSELDNLSTLLYRRIGGEEKECFLSRVDKGARLTYISDADGDRRRDVFLPPCREEEYERLVKGLEDGGYVFFEEELEGGPAHVPVVTDGIFFNPDGTKTSFNFGTDVVKQERRVAGEPGALPAGFGFTRLMANRKLGFFKALARSFTYTFFIVFKVLAILGALITGKIGLKAAGGPITVISTVSSGIQQAGFSYLMYITCLLSANVAVMNLLPIPALDGSKILFTAVEWARGKPLNRKVEAAIHTVGLILLFAFTIFVDVFHLVG